jgi:SAM-dependent methyltransferase
MATQAAYDAIAEWYDQTVRATSFAGDVVLPTLLELVGNVSGQSICDLGCGQGRLARFLAQRGAQVVGVDVSRELIALAQRDEAAEPLGIQYLVDDAMHLTTLAEGEFNGIVCNLALMDIPDIVAVWHMLRLQGWFVFSLTHPCFESPHAEWQSLDDGTVCRVIRTYFEEGFWRSSNPKGVRGRVGAHHRMLSTYVNALVETGFQIEQLVEPRPTQEATLRVPGYAVAPAFMVIRCVKASPQLTKQATVSEWHVN